jgi:uncharacterized protein
MEQKRYPLKTNIGYFLGKPIGFERSFHVHFPEIFIAPDLNVLNLVCDYRISRTQEGLLFRGDLSGSIEAQCGRCLESGYADVSTDFEELFFFAERVRDYADQIIPEDGYIDLSDTFRDNLLLALPINYVCKADCKGICTVCGQNLNLEDCGHHDPHIHIEF